MVLGLCRRLDSRQAKLWKESSDLCTPRDGELAGELPVLRDARGPQGLYPRAEGEAPSHVEAGAEERREPERARMRVELLKEARLADARFTTENDQLTTAAAGLTRRRQKLR